MYQHTQEKVANLDGPMFAKKIKTFPNGKYQAQISFQVCFTKGKEKENFHLSFNGYIKSICLLKGLKKEYTTHLLRLIVP
jgi:hypothetical protein